MATECTPQRITDKLVEMKYRHCQLVVIGTVLTAICSHHFDTYRKWVENLVTLTKGDI